MAPWTTWNTFLDSPDRRARPVRMDQQDPPARRVTVVTMASREKLETEVTRVTLVPWVCQGQWEHEDQQGLKGQLAYPER